jgi:hypothetical protein
LINITFIQYGGMTYRTVKNLALKLNKDKFNVNYMWCKPGKDLYSNFSHPVPSDKEIECQTRELVDSGVNAVEFVVNERFVPDPNLPWKDTNFWDKYYSIDTDIVFTWRSGRQEYPFCHINEAVIEWNVFGGYDKSKNIVKSLAISPWCKKDFIRNGGNENKSEVVYLPLTSPVTNENFRKELNIDSETIVCGMHQRNEDSIFDSHSLDAIKNAVNKSNKKIDFVFMGGSSKYKDYANSIGLKGHFLESSSDYFDVSKFLNTLNIYTHARKDGETLGAAIQEAMVHKLPIISHTSQWNAHIDTIGIGGKVCKTQNEYNNLLLKWVQNLDIAKDIGKQGKLFAEERYSWDGVLKQIEDIFENIDRNKDKLLLNWRPLSLDMYKKRKIYYFIRFYILNLTVMMLIKLFGQRSTRILPIIKNFFRKLFT